MPNVVLEARMVKIEYLEQKYSCCRLIAAINTRIFCGGGGVTDKEFENLVDVAKCRYGSAICIEDTYSLIGIEKEDHEFSRDWVEKNLPVELSIWDENLGLHSILVIGIDEEGARVLNFHTPWVPWDDLVELHNHVKSVQICRSLRWEVK